MNRCFLVLMLVMLGTLAMWGCSQSPSSTPSLAARTTRLQEEVEGLTAAREQLRQDLKGVSEERDRLQRDARALRQSLADREEQLTARTAERDHNLAQLEQIRRGVRALMDQVEAALPNAQPPVITTATTPGDQS